jgi:Domain of unknown function (DUF4145)
MRCPACNKETVFLPIAGFNDVAPTQDVHVAGYRSCSNQDCLAILFVVLRQNQLVVSYPAPGVDFNAERIPPSIAASMNEALICFRNDCYKAAAMLVRRTLEELCAHSSATGNNLKERLAALGKLVVLPVALLEALQDVRLLGNDAAHIEAKTYDDIGKAEVEASISVAHLVLANLFQTDLVVERLRALKK